MATTTPTDAIANIPNIGLPVYVQRNPISLSHAAYTPPALGLSNAKDHVSLARRLEFKTSRSHGSILLL
jgi:hypothetical protein